MLLLLLRLLLLIPSKLHSNHRYYGLQPVQAKTHHTLLLSHLLKQRPFLQHLQTSKQQELLFTRMPVNHQLQHKKLASIINAKLSVSSSPLVAAVSTITKTTTKSTKQKDAFSFPGFLQPYCGKQLKLSHSQVILHRHRNNQCSIVLGFLSHSRCDNYRRLYDGQRNVRYIAFLPSYRKKSTSADVQSVSCMDGYVNKNLANKKKRNMCNITYRTNSTNSTNSTNKTNETNETNSNTNDDRHNMTQNNNKRIPLGYGLSTFRKPVSLEPYLLRETVWRCATSVSKYCHSKPFSRHTVDAFLAVHSQIVHRKHLQQQNQPRQQSETQTDNLPIILDSGCGSGKSSKRLGLIYPDHFIIGIDRSIVRLNKRYNRNSDKIIINQNDRRDTNCVPPTNHTNFEPKASNVSTLASKSISNATASIKSTKNEYNRDNCEDPSSRVLLDKNKDIIASDKVKQYLWQHQQELKLCGDNDSSSFVRQVSHNVWLVRAELVDFWRCIVQHNTNDQKQNRCCEGNNYEKHLDNNYYWDIRHHYLLYPNPYPKKSQWEYRWYGHPSFPILMMYLMHHPPLQFQKLLNQQDYQQIQQLPLVTPSSNTTTTDTSMRCKRTSKTMVLRSNSELYLKEFIQANEFLNEWIQQKLHGRKYTAHIDDHKESKTNHQNSTSTFSPSKPDGPQQLFMRSRGDINSNSINFNLSLKSTSSSSLSCLGLGHSMSNKLTATGDYQMEVDSHLTNNLLYDGSMTNFEKKYIRAAEPIYEVIFIYDKYTSDSHTNHVSNT